MRLSPFALIAPFIVAALLVGCAPTSTTPTDDAADANTIYVAWDITDAEPGAFDQPNTSVSLTLTGAAEGSFTVGLFPGSFADGRTMASLQDPNAILTGTLWWAGAGDELAVHRTAPDTLTVLHRGLDEMQDSPPPFTPLTTIAIPAEAKVETVPLLEGTASAGLQLEIE
jgi:hypothetical protein